MEDVDEGFGSNESNYCNADKEDLLNDLKYLSGQKVIDKETNLDKIFNSKVCENGKSVIGNGQVINYERNGSENDLDLRNDKATEEHEEHSVHLSVTDNKIFTSESENKHEETAVLKLEKDVLKSDDLDSQNDFPDHSGNSREAVVCRDVLESEFQSNCTDKELDKSEHKSINGHNKDDVNEDKKYLEKKYNNNTNFSNKTPVKQPTSSAEGERSPFLLDDKVRNSLKGLVAKVKSSELSREGCSPTGSSVSSDSGPATPSKTQEKIHKEENEKDSQTKQLEINDIDIEDYDEDILSDDEDGIPMEIGSESEDELLDLSLENAQDKECNNEETDLVLVSGSSNGKSRNVSRLPEAEHTKNIIPVEITSDTEECAGSGMRNEIRHDSVEKMQFEDDSNSNGSSRKINDIVDFLNRDLSRTNSPLTTNDNLKNNVSSRKNNLEIQEDTGEKDLKDKNGDEMKKNIGDKTGTVHHTKRDATGESEIKSNDSNTIKDDNPSIQTSHLVKKSLIVENNSSEEENSEKKNLSYKSEADKNESVQTELVRESKIDDEEDDDDDDVIFEGATMPAMRNEFQRRTLSSDVFLKSVKKVVDKNATDAEVVGKSEIDAKGEDDDVIFEKEVKAESAGPKQNCDNEKAKSKANELMEKTEISISRPPNNDSRNGEIETSAITSNDEKGFKKTTSKSSRNSADRKRSAEEKEIAENDSKRSKLDLTGLIGRLGSRVEPARIEVLDTDEEDEKSVVTETAENEKHAESTDTKKEKENKNLITVTERELQDLVREKVKQHLTSQRDTLVAKLSQKVKELQQNNDLWKRQVKDLQVKVNDVTVLQQKLEKRKAATAALRQITTRNVAVQVDEGRTSSSKNTKGATSSPRVNAQAQVPFVSTPNGSGTIRLPIPQSSVTPVLTTQLTPGSKVVTTSYQTPSVKSLLDTTRVQKTVGSVQSVATTSIGTSVIGLLQYPQTYMAKPTTSQGFVQQNVTQVVTSQVSAAVAKPVTLTSPNASKVIDLTDDDDTMKTRLVALQPGLNTVTSQQAVRHVIAPAGTQFVRAGLPNQQTYQLVLTSPPAAIRPGMMVTVAAAVSPATSLIQAVPQSQQTLVTPSPAVAPGTTLARAAVPSSPIASKAPVCSHPAPFPVLPQQQTAGLKGLPPKPSLKISRVSQGIVLSWNMSLNDTQAEVSNYQLFAYQETSAQPVATLWKKVGDVKALPLPMACTLTQFQVGNKYHFAVRAMDIHNRVGQFSDPGSIHLTPNTPT